jgi:hypothetical protein
LQPSENFLTCAHRFRCILCFHNSRCLEFTLQRYNFPPIFRKLSAEIIMNHVTIEVK